jgi:hypothetical protein
MAGHDGHVSWLKLPERNPQAERLYEILQELCQRLTGAIRTASR